MFQMINSIIDAISTTLNNTFGDDYEIYTEDIKQGLQEPCFSILCINPKENQVLDKRYLSQNQFCIHYFPSTDHKRSECYSMIHQLSNCLEVIDVDGDLCRGINASAEIVNDVLSYFINYDMYIYKNKGSEPAMETVDYNTGVKG